jgi:beta-glucosidase
MSHNPPIDFSQILDNPSLWENITHHNTPPLGQGNPDFLYGVGTSMYQDSGRAHCPDSQWSDWENKNVLAHEQSGTSVDLFALYQTEPLEIIKRLKLLSVNTYRFSIEWSHLEPTHGKRDVQKLQAYIEFCRVLRDHDIQPFITLHHFSEPRWFHQLGSFEKEENITYFTDFCRWAFTDLIQDYQGKPLVQYFCTINEPGVEAYCRYLVGFFSPNLYCRFQRGAKFLLNMLKAHTYVYPELKKIAASLSSADIQIGISHQYLRYYPTHFLMRPVAHVLNKFNDAILHFFKTGVFECKIPLICHVVEDCSKAGKPKADFAGVQFYGRCYIGLKGVDPRNKPATSMWGIHEDPEGVYEAMIAIYEAFNVPIIISENGISTQCDKQRARYLSRALYAAEQASKKIGPENILGYILWSFSDNYEWFLGWQPTFGAFSLTNKRGLSENYKPGAEPFVQTIAAWKNTLPTWNPIPAASPDS